ncbi:MAG: flagellar hook-length control protein FliK [Lachnospiraceae bacterium]|nr:flagellar hook-length control protein FliK [Lachnospiraceae bacterium]
MVNSKFLTVSYSDLQLDKGNMSGTKKTDTDFTKILDEQRDNFKTDSNDKEDNLNISEAKSSSKREEIQKLYKEVKINKKDEIIPEENFEEVSEQVMQFLQNVIEKISEEFNISAEEVIDGIKKLDLEVVDLFDVKNISKLVVSLSNQKEMSSLLLDDGISGLIKEIFADAGKLSNSLKESFALTDEEFTKFLQKFDEAIKVEDFLVNKSMSEIKVDTDLVENEITKEVHVEAKEVNKKVEHSGLNQEFDKNSSNSEGKHNSNVYYEGISMESVMSKLQNVVETNSSIARTGISEAVMNQILDGISANVNSEMTSLELQLNPESLGKVNVTVSAKEGILTAQIVAQTEIAKEAIESQISVLKETFENQGLKVEEVEVTLASKSFDQNLSKESSNENGQSKSRRHISKEELDEINGIRAVEEEKVMEEVLKELGTTVSYQA